MLIDLRFAFVLEKQNGSGLLIAINMHLHRSEWLHAA